jgi:hypothetical protein
MIRINLCETCVHLHLKTDDTDRWNLNCDAFPEGIPDDVLFCEDDRRTIECSNGIRFEEGDAEAISRRYSAPAGQKKSNMKDVLLKLLKKPRFWVLVLLLILSVYLLLTR